MKLPVYRGTVTKTKDFHVTDHVELPDYQDGINR